MEGIFLCGLCIPPKLMVPSCWDGSPAVLAAVPSLCYRWDAAATFTSRLQLFGVIINKSCKVWIWSALPYTPIALNAVKNCERILGWNEKKKESFKTGFGFELWFTALRRKPLLCLTLLSSLFQVCGFVCWMMCVTAGLVFLILLFYSVQSLFPPREAAVWF